MNYASLRRAAVPGIAAMALGLTLSACGAGNESGGNGDSGGAPEGKNLSGTIKGAGSSAQQAAQQAWTSNFQQSNSDVTIDYNPVGSGGGIEQFTSGAVDFAGSDSALDAEEGEVAKAKKQCGADALQVPNYISPIAIVYNLDGVKDLKLDAATVSKIFNGDIKKWNDPAIAKLNEGAKLPDTAVTPVHRSDESGTTKNLTDYLEKASDGAWPHKADKVWPIKGGEGANQTSGMISAVKQGQGTIGYADESQAKELSTAMIKVGSEFVKPSAEGAAVAFEASPKDEEAGDTSLVVKIDRKTTKSGAYPVFMTSYVMACPSYDKAKADVVKAYLKYVVSNDGQKASVKSAGNAPLPEATSTEAEKILDKISAK